MPVWRDHRSPKTPFALPRSVRRALDGMRADPARAFTVDDLAAIGGVQRRTLQRQFRRFLGATPRATLRSIRLANARQELLRAPTNASVIDIAFRSGFGHAGRFSEAYRRHYGEPPSRTLRRHSTGLTDNIPAPPVASVSHDRPTIAVMPIKAADWNAGTAASIADELAAMLSRAGITVVSEPRSARYQLTGTIREEGKQARLTIHLLETATGRLLAAHRHDGLSRDGLVSDERAAMLVAATVQPFLRAAEIGYAQRKADADLKAYDLTMKALPLVLALDADSDSRALDLLERAMAFDPDYSFAAALASWCHAQRVVYQFVRNPAADRTSALRLARHALELGGDSSVLAILGNALTSAHDLETARIVVDKALSVDGASAWAWNRSGWIDVYSGLYESATERFSIALELAPHDPLAFNALVGLGCAYFQAARYLDAAQWLSRAIAERPSAVWAHRMLCPAYAQGGRKYDAQRSLRVLRQSYPELTAGQVTLSIPLPQSARSRVADGLVSVGLPP